MGSQRMGSGGTRRMAHVYFCVVGIFLACAVQATEADYIDNAVAGAPHVDSSKTEQKPVDTSVGKQRMEAKAASMLEEEEHSEEMIHRAAVAYRRNQHPQLGESASVADDSPPAPWVAEEKAKKQAEETKKQERRIQSEMRKYDAAHAARLAPGAQNVASKTSETPDLGESIQQTDSNTLTMRAQATAQEQTKQQQRSLAIKRAKQIAQKVRQLVKKQQKFESTAQQHVKGSILGKAVEEHDKAAAMSAQDELLAHKLEDEQAQHTMQHLIESERKQQMKAFQKERQKNTSALNKLRAKLKREQDKMVKQVRAETTASVVNVEKELSKTSVAQAIETVVKKKLAKKLNELKTAGLKQVEGVTAQLSALQHRVRRLRREQTRLKIATASMRRNLRSHRDLGESSGVGVSQQ